MYEALFYFITLHLKLSIIFEIIFVRNFLVGVPNLILNELSECFLFNFRNGVPIIELCSLLRVIWTIDHRHEEFRFIDSVAAKIVAHIGHGSTQKEKNGRHLVPNFVASCH